MTPPAKKLVRTIRAQVFKLRTALRKPSYNGKVFCIGYNKTGTTSLGKALQLLNYRHSTFNKQVWRDYRQNELFRVLRYTAKFDSVDDLPWLKEDMIPLLDRVFPNSKFIYLTRDEDSWKKSIYNWTFKMTGQYPDMVQCLADYRKHRDFVMHYFRDKPKDRLLVLDVNEAKAFKKLGDFLGKTPPEENLPHWNRTFIDVV